MLAFSYVIDDEMMQLFTRSHFETPSSESMNRELCGKCKVIIYKFWGELSLFKNCCSSCANSAMLNMHLGTERAPL